MTQPFVDWNAQPGREVMPGDVIWEAACETLQVIRAEMKPGTEFAIHQHEQEQIIVLLQGALEFSVGGQSRVVRPGEAICIPTNVRHGGRVHGDETAVTLEAFHPPRADFGQGAHPMDLRSPR